MAVNNVFYYANSAAFNSVTYDKSSGGPIEVTQSENSNVVASRSGAAILPTAVKVVERTPSVFVKLQDITVRPTIGTKASLVVIFTYNGGTKTRTYSNMVFVGQDHTQIKSQPGETVLRFDHESSDGTTDWYADA